MKKIPIFLFFLFFVKLLHAASYDGRHGWPAQKAPSQLIVCSPGVNAAEAMLLESLSGLAAKAVNEKRFDTMVWTEVDNVSYRKLYTSSVKALHLTDRVFRMDVWQLLDYLKKKKIVKGYILYHLASGERTSVIDDYSSNVATVYASLLSGVLIDESLQQAVLEHGLKELKDARKETLEVCFEKNKHKLNNASALSIHPQVNNLRDYAIAHRLMLYADKKDLVEKVLSWVRPLSPIMGWGCGDEYDFTSVISEWGHYNTATDWCFNLPVISSLSTRVPIKKAHEISPLNIQFADTASMHSFVMSDGDNMQWTMGSFRDNPNYVGHGELCHSGLSWTLCPTNLSIISPFTWNELADI